MWQAVALVVLFLALVAAGLLFVNHSLYKDFEGKDPVVQVAFGRGRRSLSMLKPCGLCVTSNCILQALFAVVFALSVSLLLLILSEILGVLSHRSVAKAFSKFVCLARLARVNRFLCSVCRTSLITWRADVICLLAIILAALPYYQCYKLLARSRELPYLPVSLYQHDLTQEDRIGLPFGSHPMCCLLCLQ